jgi:hypothetical protein
MTPRVGQAKLRGLRGAANRLENFTIRELFCQKNNLEKFEKYFAKRGNLFAELLEGVSEIDDNFSISKTNFKKSLSLLVWVR